MDQAYGHKPEEDKSWSGLMFSILSSWNLWYIAEFWVAGRLVLSWIYKMYWLHVWMAKVNVVQTEHTDLWEKKKRKKNATNVPREAEM